MNSMNPEKIMALYAWAGCDPPGNESAIGYIMDWIVAILAAVIGHKCSPLAEYRVPSEAARSAPAAVLEEVATSARAPNEEYDVAS